MDRTFSRSMIGNDGYIEKIAQTGRSLSGQRRSRDEQNPPEGGASLLPTALVQTAIRGRPVCPKASRSLPRNSPMNGGQVSGSRLEQSHVRFCRRIPPPANLDHGVRESLRLATNRWRVCIVAILLSAVADFGLHRRFPAPVTRAIAVAGMLVLQ